jgi:hypothetical protein
MRHTMIRSDIIRTVVLTLWVLTATGTAVTEDDVPENRKSKEIETVIENITVENTQFPLRVFLDDQPVGNLKKDDFKLYVDSIETPINGFYEVRKKLDSPPSQSPAASTGSRPVQSSSRLFVLIFNVSDYNADLGKDVDMIFQKILRPADRFMVISNNFFLPESTFNNPEIQKKRVVETLQREAQKLRLSTTHIELELKTLGDSFLERLDVAIARDPATFPYEVFRDFFRDYILIFEEFKHGYFDMAKEQYIKVAEYLRTQDAEKWVLNFFQVGIFPRFKLHGRIQTAINTFSSDPTEGALVGGRRTENIQLKQLIIDHIPRLDDVNKWMVDSISKLFVNSEATIHTLLRKPMRENLMDYYEYKPISTDSESILREIALLTGGQVIQSNDTGKFLDKIISKEDIYYMITYPPRQSEPRDASIRVELNSDKNYRLVYDNQKKSRYFKKILAKLREHNPQIKIGTIRMDNDILSVKISNMKTIPLNKQKNAETGRIEAKITIMDNNSDVVWKARKFYRATKSDGVFQTKIPTLKEGSYNVLVEVRDLLSWKSDAMGESFKRGT